MHLAVRRQTWLVALALAMVGPAWAGPLAQRLWVHFAVSAAAASPAELACLEPCVAPGLLTLETAPWTQVVIDGEARGTTPLYKARLLPGPHTIRFINEDAALDHSQTFDLAGGMVTRVKGTFDRSGAANQETLPLQPTGPSCEDCSKDLVAPAWLTIDSKPWAVVYVDGRRVGTTPLFKARVASGTQHVMLELSSGGTWADEVTLEQDSVTRLKVVDGARVEEAPAEE